MNRGDQKRARKAWIEECPLRRWRVDHGVTLKEAANLVGVSVATIQNWEAAANVPTAESFASMARAMSRDADFLLLEWSHWVNARPYAEVK